MTFPEEDKRVEDALTTGRPEPAPRFEDELRGRLRELEAREGRPAQLWTLIAAYAACGLVLLIVAAIVATGG